jgi:crossover junction endodeoxyribonuclease RusA
MRAFLPKGTSRPVLTSTSGEGLKNWEQAIRTEALTARMIAGWPVLDEPVEVYLHFLLPRPKSKPKRVWAPTTKPDLDKLVRAALDALTNVVWRDDSIVIQIFATKSYAEDTPGVHLEIVRR